MDQLCWMIVLPLEVVEYSLFYLDIKSLFRLDSAFTSHQWRDSWLILLNRIIFPKYYKEKCTSQADPMVSFFSCGKYVISYTFNGGEVYNVATQTHVKSIRRLATAIALPNGNIITGSSRMSFDPNIEIWNLDTNTLVTSMQNHSNAISSLCLLSDGIHLAAGTYTDFGTAEIIIFNLTTGQREKEIWNEEITYYKSIAELSPGRLLTAVDYRNQDTSKLVVWNIENKSIEFILDGYGILNKSLIISHDNNKIITLNSNSREIAIFNSKDGHCEKILPGFHADNSDVSISCLLLLKNGRLVSRLSLFTPDPQTIPIMKVWNMENSTGSTELLFSIFENNWTGNCKELIELPSHSHPHRFASLEIGCGVCIWNSLNGMCERVLSYHSIPGRAPLSMLILSAEGEEGGLIIGSLGKLDVWKPIPREEWK